MNNNICVYICNKTPTQAFTPPASNEIWCQFKRTALLIKDLRMVIGNSSVKSC